MVGAIAYLAVRVHLRGGDEPLPLRVLFVVVPLLDAKSDARQQWTPRAVVLFAIGILIVVTFAIVEKVIR